VSDNEVLESARTLVEGIVGLLPTFRSFQCEARLLWHALSGESQPVRVSVSERTIMSTQLNGTMYVSSN
jgi:hypothetical protein